MTKTGLPRILVAALLYGIQAAIAADPAVPTSEDVARRPPWGDGPPPWIKDGKVDEAARQAWLAKRAVAAVGQADAARPTSPGRQEGGQAGHQHNVGYDAGKQAETSAQAAGARAGSAARWGGTREVMLWLTDAPPSRGGRPGGGGEGHGEGRVGRAGAQPQAGMSGMAMGEGNDGGVPVKRVWLRQGNNPQTARPATGEETALLLAPGGKASELPVEPHGGPYNVTFPMPELGYYNVYFLRRTLDQDTLGVAAAKVETVRGTMGRGGENAALVAPRLDARMPVEIVRERKPDEALTTRISYGDPIAFQVLKGGKPVQNARVTFTSGRGWSNSVQSDEDGRAQFTVIRDYYPADWGLFDKRHRETYLVSASFATQEAGEYQGSQYASTRYTATLSGAYYPGVSDYESYANGLMVGLIGLLFTGTSVWWFRRRRVRPFQEVRFDD